MFPEACAVAEPGPEPVAVLLGSVLAPSGAGWSVQVFRGHPDIRRTTVHRAHHHVRGGEEIRERSRESSSSGTVIIMLIILIYYINYFQLVVYK